MEFPVPSYTSFTIPTGATSGARITFNENGNGEIRVYNDTNLLVTEIGGNDGAVINWPVTSNGSVRMTNGAVEFGSNTSFVNAGHITEILAFGEPYKLSFNSGHTSSGNTTEPVEMYIQAGQANATTGNAAIPRLVLACQDPTTEMDEYISGSIIKCSTNGVPETWHTPTFNASWATDTSFNGVTPTQGFQYRKMSEDNVWLYGCFTVTGAGAGATVCQLPSGYYSTTKQSPFPILERTAAGVFQTGFGYVSTAGLLHIDIAQGFTRNAGDEFMVNAHIPIGNVA